MGSFGHCVRSLRLFRAHRSGSTARAYREHAEAVNWNPRQCAKGYTFHGMVYGPYRLKHPIIRKGWKAWADARFPDLDVDDNRSKYNFDSRGTDDHARISWENVFP